MTKNYVYFGYPEYPHTYTTLDVPDLPIRIPEPPMVPATEVEPEAFASVPPLKWWQRLMWWRR